MDKPLTSVRGGDVLQRQRLALLEFYQARAARRTRQAASRAAAVAKREAPPTRSAWQQ